MKTLIINNLTVLLDDDIYEQAHTEKWYVSNGYIRRTRDNTQMHHLVLTKQQGYEVDHINGNQADNRRSNLRYATTSQNCANQKTIRSSCGYKGVTFDKATGKYMARIGFKKKDFTIGRFDNPHHAAMARDITAKELFGEFAILNFPSFSQY